MLNFIVNIHSGKGSGNRNLKKVTEYCNNHNIQYTVHITNAPKHATTIAKELSRNGADTLVAVGGDVEKTSLGFIPSGRGNDFAHGIGLPLDPIKALKIILRGKLKYIDYIQVGEKRCLNIGGTGLDIDVLKRVAGRQGKITYLNSLLYCVNHFEPYNIEVTLSGEAPVIYSAIIVGICNGKQFGGGLRLSPDSVFNDGLMELIVIQMPKGSLFPPLLKFLHGKHLSLPITKVVRCEEVTIHPLDGRPVQLDGEIYENTDLNCKIIKGGLKTFEI